MSVIKASLSFRRVFVGLLCSGLVFSAPAYAQQQQPPKQPPKQQQPAAKKPAAPAGQAPAAEQSAAPAAATVVQVKPEPSQPNWIKICGEDQNAKKKICYTTRDFVSDQNQPVLAVAVYDVQGEPQKIVRFLLPLGFILAPGVRFSVDTGAPQAGRFAVCFPNGCFAEVGIKDDVIATLKRGKNMAVSVQNQFGREVSFQVPLTDFGKSFDGPPVDPAVLAAEQKRLQEQMQKQAEEMRKKMGGQAPAAGAAPAVGAAPAPKAP